MPSFRAPSGSRPGIRRWLAVIAGLAARLRGTRRHGDDGACRAMIEAAPDAIVLHRHGTILYANPAAANLLGAKGPQTLIGQRVLDMVAGVDRERVRQRLERLHESGAPMVPATVRLTGFDGQGLEVEATSARVEFDGGDAVQTVLRDGSLRREAEAALRHEVAMEQVLSAIAAAFVGARGEDTGSQIRDALQALGEFSGAGRGYVYLRTDPSGPGGEMFEYAHEWCLRGMEPMIDRADPLRTSDMPWLMERLERLQVVHMAGAEELPEEAARERLRLAAGSGEATVLAPIGHDGRLTGFLGFEGRGGELGWSRHDIGLLRVVGEIFSATLQRAAMEAALERSRASYAAVFDNLDAQVYVADMDTFEILFANRALRQSLGHAVEGRPCWHVLAGLDGPCSDCNSPRLRARAADGDGGLVWEDHRVDGRWYECHAQAVTWFDGRQVRLEVSVDVTDRKRAEAELRRSRAETDRAGRRLIDAIESISEGFALWDADDRLVRANQRYLDAYPLVADAIRPGVGFEELARLGIARGQFPQAEGCEEQWLQDRLARHRNPTSPHEQSIAGGRWVLVSERRTSEGGIVGTRTDITGRKTAEATMSLASAVFAVSTEGLMVTDPDNRIRMVNRAFTDITGYTEDEVLGRDPSILNSGRHDADFYRTLWSALAETGHWEGEIWNRRKNGDVFPEWLSITAVRDDQGAVTQYAALFSDITRRKKDEERVWRRANFDALTELPNRPLFLDRLGHAIAAARRENHGFAVLFIDLDGFKAVNDDLGHAAGDELLQQVAQRLRGCVRESDTIARLAGDEFTAIVEGAEGPQDGARIAGHILSVLARPYELANGKAANVSASIGIAFHPGDGVEAPTLLAAADAAMYAAKHGGKNRFCLAGAQPQSAAQRAS